MIAKHYNVSNLLAFTFMAMLFISCQSRVEKAIECSKNYIGVPYKYGGEGGMGIDCSALMQRSFSCAGINLPRRAVWQSRLGNYVTMENLKAGNLVFFKKPRDREISHVGLVISGEGFNAEFIHASEKLGRVEISRINDSHWSSIFVMGKLIAN